MDILFQTLLFILLIGILCFSIWVFNVLFDAFVSYVIFQSNFKKFKGDFEAAITNSQPNWDRMKRIAKTRSIKPHEINELCEDYSRDILSGKRQELLPHLALIESYIESYSSEGPFESLPSDIKIHFERLRTTLGSVELLTPLSSQIKDFIDEKKGERNKDRIISLFSFIIGLTGLALTIVSYYFPLR
ncbi:TPA: hypothetical protein ACVU44_004950 [Vibrio parahaemolyticus]|uniref:hypothetical protein n=1 Tax=Vibrio parahaemolyticus TaxID=670 RepID=UPI00112173B7|nr:hypothetical protein [Vibrio parahaemolyticus]EHH1051832.1 hypothetical protein [Vibrio parahaemolyticus]MBD6969615.1 hypothetical protein [Vibrio parahaemolyticus]MBE4103243.1 hypothetical protein [Vibrio parahaemolyticus]TOH42444.1 hypothetical protein CGI81_23990 [Vibrio parahaemolyticus]HCE1777877.1 hypothetical protein [Vibrio parahaemolyticus]